MSTNTQVQIQQTELISEIDFLKIEINFLMKVLRNAYCASIADDKVKTLDSYWKSLESFTKQLEEILSMEDRSEDLYKKLNKEIRQYKVGLYNYMMDCKDCLIKKC